MNSIYDLYFKSRPYKNHLIEINILPKWVQLNPCEDVMTKNSIFVKHRKTFLAWFAFCLSNKLWIVVQKRRCSNSSISMNPDESSMLIKLHEFIQIYTLLSILLAEIFIFEVIMYLQVIIIQLQYFSLSICYYSFWSTKYTKAG